MKTKRKVYLATIILAILTIVFAITFVVNAGNSEKYAVEIVNDGKENRNGDLNAEITKKIIREGDSSLIYEVSVKNKLQISDIKEVTILVDTSRSIDINDPESNIKIKAKEFVEQLFNEVPKVQVSIVDSTGIKITRSTNKNSVISIIDRLTNAYGKSVDESLEETKDTFTNSDNDKLLITFTDATDTMKKVQELQNEGINAITILTNMTRESYEVEGVSTIGDTYMIDTVTIEPIIESLNKSLRNIEVRDVFSANILKYFDFSVEDPDNTPIEATDDGYIWRIDKIIANTTTTAQFKLTLKDNITIDENDTYKEIQTSSNMNVSYEKKGTRENYDVEDSPSILLCKKYSVTIKAVNAEYKSVPVDGIDVEVKVQKEDGTIVFDDTLTTDSEGNIIIDNLKTLGNLTFTVKSSVNKTGYVSSINNMTFDVYNDEQGRHLNVPTTGIEKNINNDKRTIEILFPIETQTFRLDVDLAEKDNTSLKIGNVEFRLIQPTINSQDELKALYGTTGANGLVTFTPTVMPKNGTYDYILSQITEQEEYEPMGNVTLKITFEEGKVTDIVRRYNENVTAERINDSYGIVNVFNINKAKSKFNFELELSDKINTRDKLEGAIYNIEVRDSDNTVTFENQITDSEGKINLELPGIGYVRVKVTEVRPKVGYYRDTVVKEFVVYRENGQIATVVQTPEIIGNVITSSSENKIKLNLYSEMNALQSVLQVQVVDIQEDDIPLPGVKVKLIGTMTNEEYTGVVGEDGKANFLVQPQEAGIYQYKIEIDNSSLPKGYSSITENILVSVRFDGNREIIEGEELEGPICYHGKIEYDTEEFTYKGYMFKVGVDINNEDSYNFQVKLSDREDGKPISGAKYDITIDNGTTVRKILGRVTDVDGKIATRLIASDNITITVKETKSIVGYTIDEVEQVIPLSKVNGKYVIGDQNPYEYIDNKNGAVIEGKNINYYHTNAKKDNNSVLLNLYVNKMDEEGNALSGIPMRVYSETLQDSEGQLLNKNVLTESISPKEGYFELEKIKVTNIEIPKDSEHFIYIVETGEEGKDIESTLVKLKLTFRYNEDKQYVEITNAESTWGNRLIKDKTFDGYETDIAYESNLYLDIYGNYDDVGNFALDLRKVNVDGQILEGAIYDVTITRPDGSKLIRRDLKITDSVEFSGFFVSEGTTIEITEVEAPIGYKVNERTELIRVESLSDNGMVTLDLESTSDKLVVKDTQIIPIDGNNVKTNVVLDLIDESLNTFKFGITTKDKTTSNGVSGFGYYLYSNKGAQIESRLTNGEGNVVTTIGGHYSNQIVTYTIREIKTAKYYKKLREPITVNVVFTENGMVNSVATLAAQTDPNYGTNGTWNITKTNTDNGNDIDIEIFNEPQEALNVNLHTIDRITGAELNNIEYKITPSVNLLATGTTNIQVGYVEPDSIENYNLVQTNELNNYKTVKNESFSLTYDEVGNIAVDPNNLSSNLEFVSRNGKTVEFNVYVEPKVPFSINAIGYFDNTPLSGTEFTISQKDDTTNGTTKNNGIANIYNDIFGTDKEVIYTITENKVASGYAKIEPFEVKVTYNSNREITDAVLVGEENRWISVTHKQPSVSTDEGYNGNDKGIVQITLKHYPEFLIHIQNEDRLETDKKLPGTLYSVESTIGTKDDEVLTLENGIGTAELDKTLIDDTVIYTIKETRPATLYQSIIKDVKVEVVFDENGYVASTRVIEGNDYAEANKIANITDPRQNFEINVTIRNCKMLKFNITAVDSEDETYVLRGLKFNAESTLNEEKLHTNTMQTDINGQGTLSLDKDYANETITYTITETEKLSGYQFPSEELIIEVTFDSNGKMIPDTVRIVKGSSYTEILGVVADTFDINLKIVNYETEEFGVNILSIDKYDSSIKIEDVNYEAYLSTLDYQMDSNYKGNGITDEKGETFIQFGKYVSNNPNGDETRRLIIKESNLNENYRPIRGEIAVDVTFDANGIVKGVNVPEGLDAHYGWIADGRFVSVTQRRHTISVTIKHYPNLFMNVKATDIYTGEELAGKYYISNQYADYHGIGVPPWTTNIDYIGSGYGEILSANYETTADGEWAKEAIGPTGTRETPEGWREFYIYEQEEPSSPMQYQRYKPRYISTEYDKIIGKIRVNYDDRGRIESYSIEERSSNNIPDKFIEVEILDGQNLGIKIKYAPITTMQVTTRDAISKAELSNIRVMPYMNNTDTTNTSHEYRTMEYYTTNTNGTTNYTYWGANINEGQNEYHIDTSLMGWQGYFPSGLVKIHVAYDTNGRISAADVLSTDENGVPNAEIVGFENNNLRINILYNRKFNIKINKKDEYDTNMKLNATFNIQSDNGTNIDINSGKMQTLGMIWPGKTVRYNLTETIVPQSYFPIDNVEFDVTFGKDGTISKVESDSKIFTILDIREAVDKVKPTMVQDLEVAITNEAQFIVKLNVTDSYYPEKALEGLTYSITNEKVTGILGDKDPESATGNPTTNNAGKISVPVGKAHKNETRIYTIQQTSTANGYYTNNEIVKLEVEFNELGKIKDYHVIQGETAVSIDAEKFKNQRYVELDMKGNKPKELQLGIVNTDKLTGQPIIGDTYHVKAEEIKAGTAIREKDFVINEDGSVIDKINEFKETPGEEREVLYTISKITKTNTYRKIQDIVLQITFREDGSIKYKNVLSNPSNVKVDVALGGKLQYIGENPVHILLTIENDNTYDFIVKDEDKNYKDLGIPGTQYDITVNGEKLELTTDKEGLVKSLSRVESGLITINIVEREAGIGYKSNVNNNTTIQVQKGEVDYSLELVSNSNPDYADVVVNSEYGTINVIFKNETRASLTLVKDVADVRYRITEQEDNETIREIGTDINDTIAKEELYYELGVTPQNKIRVYTFEEVSIPEDYNAIERFKVTVEYDTYGKIKNITTDSNRIDAIEKVEGSNDIIIIVSEQKLIPDDDGKLYTPYTVKVVSQEADSNLRINEAIFDVNITEGAGNEIIHEEYVTSNAEKNGYVLEKGVIKIEELINSGEINIHVNQLEPAEGYKFGTQITSGLVKVKVEYNGDKPTLEIIDNSELEVEIDEKSYEIIIKVDNEPEAQMQINNILKTKDEEDKTVIEPIEGSKFIITSEIQTRNEITPTDLNVTTAMTDEKGNTSAKVGIPYIGKTVLYTIHQIERTEYEPIGDIVVLVQYDTKGLIKYYEIISNPDEAIVNGEKGTRNIQVQIINTIRSNKHGYKVVIEKHRINNEEYGELIPGAKFRIEVEQQYGEYYTSWESITDSEGIITSQLFDGYGNISIKLTEIDAPEGFEIVTGTKELRLNRNKNTGKLNIHTTDINYEFSKENDIIYVKFVDEPREDLYTIMLNKADKKTGKLITQSSAKFDVTMIGEENIGTEEEPQIEEVSTYLGEFETDNKGKAKVQNLPKPEKAGTYKYIITEKEAPNGYLPLEEAIVLQIKFIENEQRKIVMGNTSDIRILSGDASIKSKVSDLLNITVNNFNQEDVNKYALDITKVDAHTGEPIENMAVFKVELPDQNNTSVYTETMENDYGKGKLDYCYIEQDKDYSTRLTRMAIPTKPGIHKYIFKEIAPPEGYVKFDEELELTIDFREDENTGKIYIYDIKSSNEKYMRIKTLAPCSTDTVIDIDILNNSVVYTVEYRANDNDEGTNNLPGTQNKGEDIAINLDTKVPERDGYEFLGWATHREATTPEYQPGDLYDNNADLVLYAVWKKARFRVNYDDNVEDIEIKVPDEQIKEKGKDLKLSSEILTRDGYEFLGWATDKKALEAEYQAGDNFSIEADTTLYAIWKLKLYTITYDDNVLDVEIPVPDAQEKKHDENINLSEQVVTRDEWVFDGWATDKEAEEATYAPGDEFDINEDTTLYAVWVEKLWLNSEEYQIVNAEMGPMSATSLNGIYVIKYDETQQFEYNDGDRFIIGIIPQTKDGGRIPETQRGTTLEEFINNLQTNADRANIKVYQKTKNKDSNGEFIEEEVDLTSLVSTGMRLEITKGRTQKISLKLSVMGDFVDTEMKQLDEDGDEYYLRGNGITRQVDSSIMLSNCERWRGDQKSRWKSKFITYNSGMEFVIALDIDFNGEIAQTNYNRYKNTSKNRAAFEALRPWNK